MQDKWDHISKTWGSGFLITRFVSATVSPVCLPFFSVIGFFSFNYCLFFKYKCFACQKYINAIIAYYAVLQFASFEKAREVEEFFASRTKPSIARTLKQSLERVQINAKWVQSIQTEKPLAEAVKELAHRKY